MARYDKYDPVDGGFRAPLAADLAATAKTGNGNPISVGLDANGRVVTDGAANAGNSGTVGVLCTTQNLKAGDIVDVMTDGEIVEMADVAAGSVVTAADATGVLNDEAVGAGRTRIGHTVEATRLVVRVAR